MRFATAALTACSQPKEGSRGAVSALARASRWSDARQPDQTLSGKTLQLDPSAADLSRPDHLERLPDTALSGLFALRFRNPPDVLLAMGEGHPLERRLGFRVGRQRRSQRLGYLEVARRKIERDAHSNLLTCLYTCTVTHLPVQAEQDLTSHAGHTRSPRVAIHRRDHRKALGALADFGNLGIVEHNSGGGSAGLQSGLEPDHAHAPILPLMSL